MGGFLTDLKVDGADYASQITYNPAGRANSVAVGPPGAQQTTENYNYDPASGLLTWQDVRRGSSIKPLLTLCYDYYPSHQLRWLQTLLQCNETLGTNKDTLSYDYDTLGRLHDVKATGAFGEATWSETYAYDSYGNRLSVTASGKGPDGSPIPLDGLAGSPIPPNGLFALTYDTKTNHVTTPPGFAPPGFAYDAAGNQIRTQHPNGSWVRYQYDQAGRLVRVTDDSGKLIEQYAYGADGTRLQKTNSNGSTYYFWDGSNVIAEYGQATAEAKLTWSKSHIYLGGRILTTFVPETSEGQFPERAYYHDPDRLGVRLISNSSDNTVTEQVTLPFGTLIPSPSADPINPIFTSYDRSSATGLDYAINRHYQSLERFTQVDPAGMAAARLTKPSRLNMYSYAGNDPVNNLDLLGLDYVPKCSDTITENCVNSEGAYVGPTITVTPPPPPDPGTPGLLPGQFTAPTTGAPGGGVLTAGVTGGFASVASAVTPTPNSPTQTQPSCGSSVGSTASTPQGVNIAIPGVAPLNVPVAGVNATISQQSLYNNALPSTGVYVSGIVAAYPAHAAGTAVVLTGSGSLATAGAVGASAAFGLAVGTVIDIGLTQAAGGHTFGERAYDVFEAYQEFEAAALVFTLQALAACPSPGLP